MQFFMLALFDYNQHFNYNLLCPQSITATNVYYNYQVSAIKDILEVS